jgi:hypothetical protein
MKNRDQFLHAYLNASYRIEASPAFVMKVNLPSPELAALFHSSRARRAAFITACNPASQPLSATENHQRQALLLQCIEQLGLHWLPGRGEDPAGEWPGEDSFLVLGIEKETACGLGRQFGQNAIVFCDSGAVPQLVVL